MLNDNVRLKISLLCFRYSIALVFFMWTIDKLARPDHAAGVFAHFYLMKDLAPTLMKSIGVLELALIAAFVLGWKRRYTYGTVAILHGISTISSFRQFIDPFTGTNLLFFASWPMLAAALAFFILREDDTLLTVGKRQGI